MNSTLGFSQDVNIKIGIKDSIQSKNLNENRAFIINLPKDYETSNKTYPVLYVLDGLQSNLIEAINVTNKLRTEMIIVAIPNTDRNRDIMPLSTPTYEVDNPGAENFLSFIGNELIPHIEKNYRTNGTRTIRGRSLSGLFVMYAFLVKPELFDNYIGNSAGWYADMDYYFGTLTDKSFKNKDQFIGKMLFVANSLADPFDPKKEVHTAMLEFSKKVKSELGARLSFKYVTYDNYGHVPYPSFYDGLKYVLNNNE
ncbi:alpha/beta hydrolase [Rasiella rasia]|uniref:Alpha/beta hydrolase n=1 Tax=Rasiella rasia TaxID=2744027 RepID=A0A6G6GJL5_9FLAO|nr:alpha/beta hydrolase-fold protein [Rasiella rasia]QIE58690.1 alpha/beta hydrolase [Rasiella rasia]